MRSKKCPKCGRTTLNKTCEYCGASLPDIHTALNNLFDIQSLKNDFKQILKSIFTTYAIVAVILWTIVCLYNLSQISEIGLLGYLGVSLFGYAFCIAIADIIYYSKFKKTSKRPEPKLNFRDNIRNKTLEDAKTLKTDLVEADYFLSCCAECAKYRGRWFSISGKDKRFPKLPKEYKCDCPGLIFDPVIYGISIPGVESILKRKINIIQFSNRPYWDDRSEQEKENYQKRRLANMHTSADYTQGLDEEPGMKELRAVTTKYFDGVQKIQSMWSVLYNLNGFSGEHADIFETTCYENLADLQTMLCMNQKYGYDSKMPSHVPAYVRLAMLYEKQKNYQEAINICVEAIKKGAVLDGNQGQMHGRLARLIRKSGISVNEDILRLIDSTK